MVKLLLTIPEQNTTFEVFSVKASSKLTHEIYHAILGETLYNDMEIDFGGLKNKEKYEKDKHL